jgi:hypothetical protein
MWWKTKSGAAITQDRWSSPGRSASKLRHAGTENRPSSMVTDALAGPIVLSPAASGATGPGPVAVQLLSTGAETTASTVGLEHSGRGGIIGARQVRRMVGRFDNDFVPTCAGHAHEAIRTDFATRSTVRGQHRKAVRHHAHLPGFRPFRRQTLHLGRRLGLVPGAERTARLRLARRTDRRLRHQVRPQASFGCDHDPVARARVLA